MSRSEIERNERTQAAAERAGDGAVQSYDWYTRRETDSTRRARIARKRIDPATAAALTRLWAA
jgi:hypothetical protein